MTASDIPKCPHCDTAMDKWCPPDESTWTSAFQWVCFNDECGYFVRGWNHMKASQNVGASYRHRMDPATGSTGPLPCWSSAAHKDKVIKE
ncbi:MAG: hypothetical protein HQK83_12485 [Fibrobacteria bacterium]|nr:hypothetical protein [Fibrobacteria bacterium]